MATNYSLFELNEYIKRVMALNFDEGIWVRCEVSQASHSRGSVYLNVVELDKDTDDIIAQANAVIWPRSYIFLQNKLKELLPYMLEAGSEVLIKVKVDFHERYGLKLVIEDIEGYADFVAQVENNEYGYDIHIELFHSAMQGRNVENDVVGAFRQIQTNSKHYDAVIIIRGGGSKLDLAGFDNYNIGHAIAMCRLPVIIGIGHEIDTTVTDLVAKISLKTPTAVAAYIIDRNMRYEANLDEAHASLQSAYQGIIDRNLQFLNSTESIIGIVDPLKTLKRGFSIIKQDGKSIRSVKDIDTAKELEIVMQDGSKKWR